MQQRQAYVDYLDILTRCMRIARKKRNTYGLLSIACFILWVVGSLESALMFGPLGFSVAFAVLGALSLLSAYGWDYWTKEHYRLFDELCTASLMSELPPEDLCLGRIRMYNAAYFRIGDLA